MLADFLTMREHAADASAPLRYAYVGDARYNMGNSLLVMGALMGSDVRIVAPRELWPDAEVQDLARAQAAVTGATITLTEDVECRPAGAEFVHTDIWVSMGEPEEEWATRVALLTPYRVDAALMALTGDPSTKFMHCLPAYHDQSTSIGRKVAAEYGLLDGVEVTDEVFESPASIVFDQAENRMHTIKAILVATLVLTAQWPMRAAGRAHCTPLGVGVRPAGVAPAALPAGCAARPAPGRRTCRSTPR